VYVCSSALTLLGFGQYRIAAPLKGANKSSSEGYILDDQSQRSRSLAGPPASKLSARGKVSVTMAPPSSRFARRRDAQRTPTLATRNKPSPAPGFLVDWEGDRNCASIPEQSRPES